MWFRTLFDVLNPGASRPPVQPVRQGASRPRPAPCRLAVEALEDRSVPASLSVSDVTLVEGHAGSQNAVVMVSLSSHSTRTVTVNYSTADATASAGSDYQAVSGKLTFAPGQTSRTILVPVTGDRLGEPNETVLVNSRAPRTRRSPKAGESSPSWMTSRASVSVTCPPRKGTPARCPSPLR